ncbi:MAG TPA: alpha/beta hydrolase [Kofleriaceae bacterium]|nr:alpha/beta hydrolase [Kofleriaceae bacterium]
MRTIKPPLLVALTVSLAGCLCANDPGNLVPRTVAEDPSLPAIDLNGTRLHSEAFGNPDAPVIIVMHGGPGSDYRAYLPLKALADDGLYVLFWDQRGTGLSERLDPDAIDLDVYVEDLRLLIEHYAPHQPVVFVAKSWGAMYLTRFINQYGDYNGRIKGAVLTEPGAFTDRQLSAYMARLQGSLNLVGEQFNDALWEGQFVSPADHERADYRAFQFALKGAPSDHRDPNNLPPIWRPGAIVTAKMAKLAKQPFDWTTNLATFPNQVLFLRGDLNEAATLESQNEMAAAYPNARIETIAGVGHEVIWERTDEYLTHTRAYLREIGFLQ